MQLNFLCNQTPEASEDKMAPLIPAVEKILLTIALEVNHTINNSFLALGPSEESYLLQPIAPGGVYTVTVSLENEVGVSSGNPSKSIGKFLMCST